MRSYYEHAGFLLTTTLQDRLAEFFRTSVELVAVAMMAGNEEA